MDNFLILQRIGKSVKDTNEYLIWVLDLDEKQTKFVVYDTVERKIIPKDPNIKDFVSCIDSLPFGDFFKVETVDADFDEYSIHRFNYDSSPDFGEIHHSIKNKDTGKVFVPCWGKHRDHETLIQFSKFITNYEIFMNIFIEGYEVSDPEAFDIYVTKLDPSEIVLYYTDNTFILFRELRDFIGDHFAASYKDVEIKISHPSGRSFEVIL